MLHQLLYFLNLKLKQIILVEKPQKTETTWKIMA
jgi:hypothetical protein